MRKTAGYCISGQERGGGNRYARIELSEKVCDSAGDESQPLARIPGGESLIKSVASIKP